MKKVSFFSKSVFAASLLFCVIAGILISKDWNQPRFEGQPMMWWLNQYSRDSQRPHNLSNRQIKSVNAFRHFEKEGIDFLIEAGRLNKVPVSTSPWDLWSGFTHKLNNIQWIKKFGFFQTYPNRRLAALNLLKQLEFPFEWVQEHVSLPIRSQPYPQLIASITLLQGVTNHQSELINEVAPCLGLMNQNSVLDTLASLYRDQEPQPEVEKHLEDHISKRFRGVHTYRQILAKQAVFPGFARNELLEWAKSDNFYTALTALVALGGIEDTKTEAESQFKELFNTHVKEIPDAQSDEMLNRLFYDLESWRNTSAEIKQFATDFLVSRLGKFKNWQDSQVFFWIIALDPNQPKAWEFFNTQLEQAKPRDVSYALSLIGNDGSGSSLVLELLKQYAASGSTPYQSSATRALNMLRSLELTTAKN